MTAPKARTEMADRVRSLFAESSELSRRTSRQGAATLVEMAIAVFDAVTAGGKLMTCGNGGSAADAQHLVAELLVRLHPEVDRSPIPALALTLDASTLTAGSNDLGFKGHFARLVEALGRPGDALLGISTSGRSENVVRALATARARGLTTLGLLGGAAIPALDHCDLALVVPSSATGRIQECHVTAIHALAELVEDLWLGSGR